MTIQQPIHTDMTLAQVSVYAKRVLAQFQMRLYEIDDFESMSIAQEMDEVYFTEILKLFEGQTEEACHNLRCYPISKNIIYLKKTHTYFIFKRLLEIEHAIEQAFRYEEITKHMLAHFLKVKTCLLEHIDMEESTLFPYLLELETPHNETTVSYSLEHYQAHHNVDTEKILADFRKYIANVDESSVHKLPYNFLMKMLETFELELCVHALVEDMVLIPQGAALEKTTQA